MPIEWLRPFGVFARALWFVSDGRLQCHHEDGFCLLDVPFQNHDPAPLLRRLENYPICMESLHGFEIGHWDHELPMKVGRGLLTAPRFGGLRTARPTLRFMERSPARADHRTATALDRWLSWHLPYLEARLQRALGTVDASGAWALLCRQAARVNGTVTGVQVHFALADHPIQIRLAGLDRNPGWVPSAGRHVCFYYE